MLKILSYLNIALAIIYLVSYLLNSTSYAMVGIFAVAILNLLVIRNIEKELKFTVIHYVLGLACMIFAGFLMLWVVNIIRDSLVHNYFGNSWFYILLTSVFAISIVLHGVIILYHKNRE